MAADLRRVFERLRGILEAHASEFSVTEASAKRYCLEGPVGPATLGAWGGKMRRPSVPVAWVDKGKTYVSYHLMGLGNASVRGAMSRELAARMQGKTCFNFRTPDDRLFAELEAVTAQGLAAFRDAGFVASPPKP